MSDKKYALEPNDSMVYPNDVRVTSLTNITIPYQESSGEIKDRLVIGQTKGVVSIQEINDDGKLSSNADRYSPYALSKDYVQVKESKDTDNAVTSLAYGFSNNINGISDNVIGLYLSVDEPRYVSHDDHHHTPAGSRGIFFIPLNQPKPHKYLIKGNNALAVSLHTDREWAEDYFTNDQVYTYTYLPNDLNNQEPFASEIKTNVAFSSRYTGKGIKPVPETYYQDLSESSLQLRNKSKNLKLAGKGIEKCIPTGIIFGNIPYDGDLLPKDIISGRLGVFYNENQASSIKNGFSSGIGVTYETPENVVSSLFGFKWKSEFNTSTTHEWKHTEEISNGTSFNSW